MRISHTGRGYKVQTAAAPEVEETEIEEQPEPDETLTDRWDRLAREAEEDPLVADLTAAMREPVTDLAPTRSTGFGSPRNRRARTALIASAMEMFKAAIEAAEDIGPEPPPQPIHVHNHLPAHNLHVDVAPAQVTPEIHVEPAQHHFTIEAPAPPDVHVQPAAITIEQPAITVEQPAITVQPADVHVQNQPPDVHVEAPNVHVIVEPPQPRSIRVQTDPETGERVFVPDE